GNFMTNVAATWSLNTVTGGIVGADLVPSSDGKNAIFTGHSAGTAKVAAIAGGLGGTTGTFTVVPGLAGVLSVETAANGTGTPVAAQTVVAGSSITGFAIQRDNAGNFLANVPANWSLTNVTGGVANGNLSVSADGKSAVFT